MMPAPPAERLREYARRRRVKAAEAQDRGDALEADAHLSRAAHLDACADEMEQAESAVARFREAQR